MKTSIIRYREPRRLGRGALVLLGLSFLVATPAFADPILSISPSATVVSLGSSFSLDVEIGDVTDLFAYQLELTFDPSILQASAVSDAPFLTSGGGVSAFGGVFTPVLDNGLGAITILDLLLGPVPPATGVTGTGALATLHFTAIGPGSTAIGFKSSILEDTTGVFSAQTQNGSVEVASVSDTAPITGPVMLLMLAGLVLGHRNHWAEVRKPRSFES